MKLISLLRVISAMTLITVKKIDKTENIYCGFSSDLRFTKDNKLKSYLKNNVLSVTAEKNTVVIRLVRRCVL